MMSCCTLYISYIIFHIIFPIVVYRSMLMVTSRKVLPAKKNIGKFTEAFTTWKIRKYSTYKKISDFLEKYLRVDGVDTPKAYE